MLYDYVTASNDTSILTRAFPIAEAELKWWATNRTVAVKSPYTNRSYTMAHYSVTNTAPRPESYLQGMFSSSNGPCHLVNICRPSDYTTANTPELPTLNETQRANLYAELASGAETGWDYSSRWFSDSTLQGNAALRSLQVRNTIPVCLNSILCKSMNRRGFISFLTL
jgi:alpha,alpha-trehalase